MADVRGSWTVDEGIAARWKSSNLDAVFRAEWDAGNDGYLPLNDEEARPETPFPYCVYEKGEPDIVQHHTGAASGADHQQIQRIPVQFTIHAKSTASESGKQIAKRMAVEVITAFDPGTDSLTMTPDCHIITYRGPDFDVRTGDEEWAWVILYDLLIDAAYSQRAI